MSGEKHNVGKMVKWKWGNGWGRGSVKKIYTQKITRNIDGTEVTREASEDEPAYLIEQEDGDIVLKSHSEIDAD